MCIVTVENKSSSQLEYQESTNLHEVIRDIPKTEYNKKSSTENVNSYRPKEKIQDYLKLDKFKKSPENPGSSKILKRKVSDSSSSSSSQMKRGPGRPKKVLKQVDEDDDNNNDEDNCCTKEKLLKLDCNSKIKHKTSNSSSSDLSPPVLEPWSPFTPRKDSTRTPPTLSPISSMAKLSDAQKSSDEEKIFEKKIAKKKSTSSILVCDLYNILFFL